MATVTVELRDLLRNNFELFDFHYDFDDQEFKKEIEQAVIDHYLFYEIGQETPGRFKQRFKSRWLSMIGYYNKLHNTTLLKYDPLINYRMEEALEQLSNTTSNLDTSSNRQENYSDNENRDTTTNQTSTVDSSDTIDQTTNQDNTQTTDLQNTTNSTRTDNLTTGENTNEKISDYPQQPIAGGDFLSGERDANKTITNTGTVNTETSSEDTGTVIDSGTTVVTGTTSTETQTTINGSENLEGNKTGNRQEDTTTNTSREDNTNMSYQKTIEGLTGKSYQELIQLERESLIRIKSMIIQEMKPCFLMVYS